jgi:hypothetical protein
MSVFTTPIGQIISNVARNAVGRYRRIVGFSSGARNYLRPAAAQIAAGVVVGGGLGLLAGNGNTSRDAVAGGLAGAVYGTGMGAYALRGMKTGGIKRGMMAAAAHARRGLGL